jgi:16S rRNA processing protein RimM
MKNKLESWDVVIGMVTSPFGRLGELKVMPLSDFPERFDTLKKICLRSGETDEQIFKVEQVRHHKGVVLLKLEGIDSISDAEQFRNYDVTVPESERIDLPKGNYFIDDIIGMEVVGTNGQSFGKIQDILRSNANDVYVTECAMIPAVHDIVKKVDVENHRMTVEPIEGLLTESS